MADPSHVLRVGRVPQRPVVHLDLGPLLLGLPNRVHQDVDGALGGHLGVAVEHGHAHHHSQTRLPSTLILRERSALAVELGLAVEVGRLGRGVGLVRRVARLAGEDVVGGDVDEEDVARGT